MKSIPAAMTWELFDRGRWSLPAAAFGALGFPLLIFALLKGVGALNPHDSSTLTMHIVLVQLNIITFGAALVIGAWKLKPLYAYPATATTLVAGRMLPGMVAIFLETVVWTMALNAIFHLDWPIWGPALYSAVVLAAVEACFWFADKSRWVILLLTLVVTVLSLWHKSRYGSTFGNPTHLWTAVTPGEFFAMAAAAAISYWGAVVGVARTRRGEKPFTLNLVARLEQLIERLFDNKLAALSAFRTPQRAQFWYVWRTGWLAPVIVAGVILVGFIIWCFTSRDPQELVDSLVGGAPLLLCAGLITATVMGNVSQTNDLKMNQFLATRPLTSNDFARSILRAAALSVLLAWVVWIAIVAAIGGTIAALGIELNAHTPDPLIWRLIPASLVGSWIVAGCFLTAMLTGRGQLWARILVTLTTLNVACIVIGKFALTPEATQTLTRVVLGVLAVACLVGTIVAFIAAFKKGLIEAPTVCIAFVAFMALTMAAILLLPQQAPDAKSAVDPMLVYALLTGLASLAVLPLAAAPLALAWNRCR